MRADLERPNSIIKLQMTSGEAALRAATEFLSDVMTFKDIKFQCQINTTKTFFQQNIT